MREREREREPLLENALMRLRASLRLRLSALHAARAAPRLSGDLTSSGANEAQSIERRAKRPVHRALSGDLFGRKRGPVH